MDPNKRKKLEKIVEENEGKTLKGEVKFFRIKKGYGFIINPHGDVFFHYSVVDEKQILFDDGQPVEYQYGPVRDKGLSASYVKKSD